MLIEKAEAQSLINPPDATEIFLAGFPSYDSIIKHPVCFRDIILALANSNTSGSHLWGNGVVSSLPKLNCWEGRRLLECIDMVMLNAIAYYGGRVEDKKSAAQTLRSYYWHMLDEKAQGNKALLPKKRKPSDGFIAKK